MLIKYDISLSKHAKLFAAFLMQTYLKRKSTNTNFEV